jgi:Na+/phosphate symporter
MKDARSEHLGRLGTQEVTPTASLIFTDILNGYRRAKDHALNIAEAVAGEK